jgi:hypothetical protein
MSTKVAAKVAMVVTEGVTSIGLILEPSHTANLKKGDTVYVELTNALTGDKVDFPAAPVGVPLQPPAAPEPEIEEEEEVVVPAPEVVETITPPAVEPAPEILSEAPAPNPETEHGV